MAIETVVANTADNTVEVLDTVGQVVAESSSSIFGTVSDFVVGNKKTIAIAAVTAVAVYGTVKYVTPWIKRKLRKSEGLYWRYRTSTTTKETTEDSTQEEV